MTAVYIRTVKAKDVRRDYNEHFFPNGVRQNENTLSSSHKNIGDVVLEHFPDESCSGAGTSRSNCDGFTGPNTFGVIDSDNKSREINPDDHDKAGDKATENEEIPGNVCKPITKTSYSGFKEYHEESSDPQTNGISFTPLGNGYHKDLNASDNDRRNSIYFNLDMDKNTPGNGTESELGKDTMRQILEDFRKVLHEDLAVWEDTHVKEKATREKVSANDNKKVEIVRHSKRTNMNDSSESRIKNREMNLVTASTTKETGPVKKNIRVSILKTLSDSIEKEHKLMSKQNEVSRIKDSGNVKPVIDEKKRDSVSTVQKSTDSVQVPPTENKATNSSEIPTQHKKHSQSSHAPSKSAEINYVSPVYQEQDTTTEKTKHKNMLSHETGSDTHPTILRKTVDENRPPTTDSNKTYVVKSKEKPLEIDSHKGHKLENEESKQETVVPREPDVDASVKDEHVSTGLGLTSKRNSLGSVSQKQTDSLEGSIVNQLVQPDTKGNEPKKVSELASKGLLLRQAKFDAEERQDSAQNAEKEVQLKAKSGISEKPDTGKRKTSGSLVNNGVNLKEFRTNSWVEEQNQILNDRHKKNETGKDPLPPESDSPRELARKEDSVESCSQNSAPKDDNEVTGSAILTNGNDSGEGGGQKQGGQFTKSNDNAEKVPSSSVETNGNNNKNLDAVKEDLNNEKENHAEKEKIPLNKPVNGSGTNDSTAADQPSASKSSINDSDSMNTRENMTVCEGENKAHTVTDGNDGTTVQSPPKVQEDASTNLNNVNENLNNLSKESVQMPALDKSPGILEQKVKNNVDNVNNLPVNETVVTHEPSLLNEDKDNSNVKMVKDVPCEDVAAVNKSNEAQAQARAEQRRQSEVHMQFGNDGLHINTDPNSQHLPLSQPQQHYIPPPQDQQPVPYKHTTDYDGGGLAYPTVPYPNIHTRDHPVFEGNPHEPPSQDDPQGHVDNFPHHGTTSPTPDGYYRRRREGRDHTNYTLPPNLDPFKGQKGNHDNLYTNTNDRSLSNDGPPGLPLTGDRGHSDDESGLKLVVLDKTDDEDDIVPDTNRGPSGPPYFERGFTHSSNTDVYPLDNKAVERDMYKQVYDPSAEPSKPSRSSTVLTSNGIKPMTNAFGVEENDPNIEPSMNQNNFNHQNSPNPQQPFTLHVTDYDSETGADTGRSSAGPQHYQQLQQQQDQHSLAPKQKYPVYVGKPQNNAITYDHTPMQYGQTVSQGFQTPVNNSNNQQQQGYTMSQIDYERFMSNPSQLSTVPETLPGSETERSGLSNQPYDTYRGTNHRTFLLHPSATNSSHSIKNAQGQDTRVLGPGYKFQVNQYNVAKRASILNKAEQLLDARRGQYTDRSSSSDDELERIDEDEDEDDENVEDMKGPRNMPRHQALRRLRRRPVFDDTTSYNSSDDVLNTMRYHPRGPVSQTARRARLTSVNARLNKQKRIRASRRQIDLDASM